MFDGDVSSTVPNDGRMVDIQLEIPAVGDMAVVSRGGFTSEGLAIMANDGS